MNKFIVKYKIKANLIYNFFKNDKLIFFVKYIRLRYIHTYNYVFIKYKFINVASLYNFICLGKYSLVLFFHLVLF